jgi:Cof subfamily protein (haloacid dehalogenase superfamily)
MSIRALALDLDGTLLDADYSMSDRTASAVSAFSASGREVVIATGRSRRSALPWAKRLNCVSAMVCHNGAAVYDFGSLPAGELISETLMPEDLVRRLIELSHRLDLHFHAFGGDDWYYERRRPGTAIYEGRAGFVGNLVDFDALPKLRFNKTMFVARPGKELEDAAVAARSVCAGEASVFFSGSSYLEIVPLGVTKAAGLGVWLATRGLTLADAMTIGDADNDREMILEAGLGVAMAEAPAELRARAALVTGGVAEDGAAAAIEGFLAGKIAQRKDA